MSTGTMNLLRKSRNIFLTLGQELLGRKLHHKIGSRDDAWIRIVSCGNIIPASVLLETRTCGKMDYFLFNCGEEVYSRTQMKSKLHLVEHLFITHPSWKNIGGITSLLRGNTVSEEGITVFGSAKVMTNFLEEDSQNRILDVISVPEYSYYVNRRVQIDFLPIFSDIMNKNVSDLQKFDKCSVAFLIQPSRLEAENGSATLTECSEKRVEDEMEDEGKRHFVPVLVLEIPDHSYLDSLLLSQELQEQCPNIGLVLHLSPQSVLDDERYFRFLERFTKDTYHIVLNESCNTSNLLQFAHQDILTKYLGNKILPPMFSPPKNQKEEKLSPGQFCRPTSSHQFLLREGYVSTQIENSKSYKYAKDKQETQQLAKTLEEALNGNRMSEDLEGNQYPELCFLGTGAGPGCQYRGQSGVYLQTDENTAMLLDCGEGTWSHFKLCYGNHAYEMLFKIKFIFVSHSHSDHWLGIFSLLKTRYDALRQMGKEPDRVVLLAPPSIGRNWPLYSSIWPNFEHSLLHVTPGKLESKDNTKQNIFNLLNLKKLDLVKVVHMNDSRGLIIEHNDGWKIAYSGDTSPCNDLIIQGRNCDILIHEATCANGEEYYARKNKHSTISQAVAVGRKMKAKNIILTHFGHLQEKVPFITEEMLQWSNVGFAYDNMRVTPRTLPFLHLTVPIIKSMFQKYSIKKHTKVAKIDQHNNSYRHLTQRNEKYSL